MTGKITYAGLIAALVLAASSLSCAGAPTYEIKTAEDPRAIRREIEVGKAAFAKLAGRFGLFRDRDATAYLNKYLKSLALYSTRQGLEYSAGILNTPQVNAYALPGGYVLVTVGMLRLFEEPGELAGVLGHELGHIEARHILENVKIQVGTDFWETLSGIIAGPRQVITTAMDQINREIEERLFLDGYASDDEFEADAYAVRLLTSVNAGTGSYVRLLEKLGTESSTDLAVLDATHPPVRDRLRAIGNLGGSDLPELEPTEEFNTFMKIIRGAEVPRQ